MTPEERLDARRANDGTRLLATLVNGLAGAAIVGGIITPVLVNQRLDLWWAGFAIGGAVILHLVARLVLYDLKPEE